MDELRQYLLEHEAELAIGVPDPRVLERILAVMANYVPCEPDHAFSLN